MAAEGTKVWVSDLSLTPSYTNNITVVSRSLP